MRAVAILKLSKKVKDVLNYGQSVVTAMTGNAYFPSPPVPLATLASDLSAASAAEAQVLSRVKGAAETRDVKLAVVRDDLEQTRFYVQTIADAHPTEATAIIQSAGMTVRTVTLHDKPALAVKAAGVSGSVVLVAKSAARKAAYDWQYSTDQKTWTSVPSTLRAKTIVSGLVPATLYYFRVQALVGTGEQDWSQLVAHVVA